MKNNTDTEQLYQTILQLKNMEEAKAFFRDLLTEKEIQEFSSRWQIAQMLNDGIPYTQIEQQTGISSTTIARISKWLKNGKGGYQLMLNRLNHHHHQSQTGNGS